MLSQSQRLAVVLYAVSFEALSVQSRRTVVASRIVARKSVGAAMPAPAAGKSRFTVRLGAERPPRSV